MNTQLSEQQTVTAGGMGRLQQAWLVLVQLAALALLVLTLAWSPIPMPQYRILLGALAMAALAFAGVPLLRRSQWAAILGGVTLATACWLSAERTWDLPFFAEADPPAAIPLAAPVVVGAALALALLGLVVRAGIMRGVPSLAKGALAGLILLAVAGGVFYVVINYTPAFRALEYQISRAQISEMLASVSLFACALWLGGSGIRERGRWTFLPIGTVVVLAAFFALWQLR